jgi:hypothetical protein
MSMLHALAALMPKVILPSKAFNGTTIDDTNLTTYTFTQDIGTANTGRLVVAAIFFTASSSRTISSVAINGVSATQVVTNSDGAGGVFRRSSLYQAVVPTGTTGVSIVVTLSSGATGCGLSSWSIYDLSSTTAVDSDSAFSIAPTVTLPSMNTSDAGVVVANCGFLISSSATQSWTGGVTEQSDLEVDNIVMSAADGPTTGATVAPSSTLSGGGIAYGIAVGASYR